MEKLVRQESLFLFLLVCILALSFNSTAFAKNITTLNNPENHVVEELPNLEYFGTKTVMEKNDEGVLTATNYDGYYVSGDGVAVRTRPNLSASIKGRLYKGDIVWLDWDWQDKTTFSDGYEWTYCRTDSRSNMGRDNGYMVVDYIGYEVTR